MQFFDLIVIGGGISGIFAALEAKKNGIDNILILERDSELGGMLNLCIDSGFGLKPFNENLTGPEFTQKLTDMMLEMKISYKLDTTVIELKKDKTIIAINPSEGLLELRGKAVVNAVGCVESARSAVNILGRKLAGIYTIGAAQRLVNTEGFLPGKEVVIVGTGNYAINMARRILVEGAKIKAIIQKSEAMLESRINELEVMSEFPIPVLLNHRVLDITGQERVTGVKLAQIDSNGDVILVSEKVLSCDAILLSVDLEPDSKLLKKADIARLQEKLFTDIEGIFVCGNADFIHKDIDSIIMDSKIVGDFASKYIQSGKSKN